jgi:hypothetical protein
MVAEVHTCDSSYAGKQNRKIAVQTSLGIKHNPISKITKAKKTGRVVKW